MINVWYILIKFMENKVFIMSFHQERRIPLIYSQFEVLKKTLKSDF